MTRFFKVKNLCLVLVSLVLVSCNKDNPEPEETGDVDFSSGVFIINEGPFGSGTGTISFYNKATGEVTNNIFNKVNDADLGNVVQSMAIHENKGYVVVNNANKVEIVNPTTFASKGTITGFTMPRFFLGISATKAYVTQWGDNGVNGSVKIVDLSTNSITGTIALHKGAERMVRIGDLVYVSCKGGYDSDSVVAVINCSTDAFVKNITIGDNPDGMAVDQNNELWVICGENLSRVETVNNTVEASFMFPSNWSYFVGVNSAGNKVFFYQNGSLYSQGIDAGTMSTSALFTRDIYGFGIDPEDDKIYCTNPSFSSNGRTFRYSESGSLIDSFKVGIGANGFLFQ